VPARSERRGGFITAACSQDYQVGSLLLLSDVKEDVVGLLFLPQPAKVCGEGIGLDFNGTQLLEFGVQHRRVCLAHLIEPHDLYQHSRIQRCKGFLLCAICWLGGLD